MAKDFEANLSIGKVMVMVDDFRGLAFHEKGIAIPPKACHTKDYLGTCVHETAHLVFPDMSEAEIARLEHDITEVLWKRGYRLKGS